MEGLSTTMRGEDSAQPQHVINSHRANSSALAHKWLFFATNSVGFGPQKITGTVLTRRELNHT